MSKFYATVCLPSAAVADVPGALAATLAPYDLNADPSGWHPQGRWDWWHIDSRDGDRMPVRPECDGDPRLIHGATFPDGSPRPRIPLRCDGGPKGVLDLEGLRRQAAAKAQTEWQTWANLQARHPPARPLSGFLARHHDDPETYTETQAKRDHLAQPLIQAAMRLVVAQTYPQFPADLLVVDPHAYFAATLQEHVDRAAQRRLCTFALVTLDGRWHDVERFELVGTIDPGHSDAFERYMSDYIDGLDDDDLLITVLCHY